VAVMRASRGREPAVAMVYCATMNRPWLRRMPAGAVAAAVAAALLLSMSGSAAAAAPSSHRRPPLTHGSRSPQVRRILAQPSLYVGGLFNVRGQQVTVPGRPVTITGVVRPYVQGQRVLLKATVGGRLFAIEKLGLKPSPRRVYGGFRWTLRSPAAGPVRVTVLHSRDTATTGFVVRDSYAALDEQVGPGATGRMVELLQEQLAALHFYIPQTGVYDAGTELAVDAYHRLLHAGVSSVADPSTINRLLNGEGSFHVRFPGQGRHAEGNLSDQLVGLVDGSQVQLIFPISSGKPSTPTILGSYQVYSRVPGYLPDGMYYSDFFIRGYAIHGYDPAPDYPASHGCMRLPIVDAIAAFNWLALGNWVDTYYT
jgi:peptidoglycan hydrolase-like protein with peptidoglycan-binding domain